MSRVWGEADKAHQQNLIVKACLNTPGGEQSKRRSARLSALKKKTRASWEKKKRFWVSCCPVAQRSETCLLPHAGDLLVRTWSSGCFSSCEAPVRVQVIQFASWVFYFISMHLLTVQTGLFYSMHPTEQLKFKKKRKYLGVNYQLIAPTTLTSSRFSAYIITL